MNIETYENSQRSPFPIPGDDRRYAPGFIVCVLRRINFNRNKTMKTNIGGFPALGLAVAAMFTILNTQCSTACAQDVRFLWAALPSCGWACQPGGRAVRAVGLKSALTGPCHNSRADPAMIFTSRNATHFSAWSASPAARRRTAISWRP